MSWASERPYVQPRLLFVDGPRKSVVIQKAARKETAQTCARKAERTRKSLMPDYLHVQNKARVF